MLQVDRYELAWAAGFFDGEGSTSLQNAVPRRARDYATPSVSISQHFSPECLERFRRAVGGLGTVNGPHRYEGCGGSPRWTYYARTYESAQAVVAMLWPYLSTPKREQAAEVLRRYLADARTRRPYRRRPAKRAEPLAVAVSTR